MRRLISFTYILLIASALHASWQLGADLRSIDSVFLKSLRLDSEISYSWDGIRLSIPFRFSHSFSHELNFAETGLNVSVYPFAGHGFYIGASMVRMGLFWGLEAPEEKFMLFSEIMAGWTFSFPWFFIEPRISILDAFSSEEGRIGVLREAVPQYSKIRISLIAGLEIQ